MQKNRKQKDKLYTVNKWNTPIFTDNKNLFSLGGEEPDMYRDLGAENVYTPGFIGLNSSMVYNSPDNTNYLKNHGGVNVDYYYNNINPPVFNGQHPQYIDTADPENGKKILDKKEAEKKERLKQAGQTAGVAASYIPDKYWDELDPMKHVTGMDMHSTTGDALENTGKSITQSSLQRGDWWGALAGAGFKIAGDIYNGLKGSNIKQGFVNRIKQQNLDRERSAYELSNANTNDLIRDAAAHVTTTGNFNQYHVGKDARFANKAKNLYTDLSNDTTRTTNMYNHYLTNAVNTANDTQNYLAKRYGNITALGGDLSMLNNVGGVLEYDLMHDYIQAKKQPKTTMPGLTGMPDTNTFAIGGDLQTHGADWSTGLTRVDKGGTHEENPNEGVQMGIDPQGVPNLVEEGEAIFNDYVYSKRIYADGGTLKKMHLSSKLKKSFADIARSLEKEASERPNDPLSRAALKNNMELLADEQERQKQEMEAKEAQEQFASMSPEEQVALMQQAQEEEGMDEQAIQEQAMQEQGMPEEQGMMPPPSEEEMMAMQQQGMMPQMAAYGGNLFSDGGYKEALAWVRKNHPEIGSKDATHVALALWKHANSNKNNYYRPQGTSMFGNNDNREYAWEWGTVYNNLVPPTVLGREKAFNRLVEYGMPRNLAFGLVYPNTEADRTNPELKRKRNEAYQKWVVQPEEQESAKQKTVGYRGADGKLYDTLDEADAAGGNRQIFISKQDATVQSTDKKSSSTQASTKEVARQKINEFNARAKKEFGSDWKNKLGLDNQQLKQLYIDYNNGNLSLDDLVNAGKAMLSQKSAMGSDTVLSTPGVPQDTYLQGYPTYYSTPLSVEMPMQGYPQAPIYTDASGQQMMYTPYGMVPVQSAPQQPAAQTSVQQTPVETTIPKVTPQQAIFDSLGIHTWEDFVNWANKNNAVEPEYWKDKNIDNTDWKDLVTKETFKSALGKNNPILDHAMKAGYNFGTYTPEEIEDLTFDFKHGGWGKEDYADWDGSTDPAWEEAVKNGWVTKDMKSADIEKALKKTEAYQRGTEYLKKSEKNMLNYLKQILKSDAPEKAKAHARQFVDEETGDWIKGKKHDYETVFGRVRTTHPGTYWKTPKEWKRDNKTVNYVKRANGKIEQIVTDIPSEWKKTNTYSWSNADADNTYNYYEEPLSEEEKAKEAAETEEEPAPKPSPKLKNESLRYSGIFGPLAGLALWNMGVGKPSYDDLERAQWMARRGWGLANYQPIGNYMQYNPMDLWAEYNRAAATGKGTDRALQNSAAPLAMKQAYLTGSGYNQQANLAEMFRKAYEYNDNKEKAVLDSNRFPDQFNATAFNQTSQANAQLRNQNSQFAAQMALQAGREREERRAGWYNALYGNIRNIAKAASDYGKENAQHNLIARLAADGYFGSASPDTFSFQDYLTWKEDQKRNGGK